MIIEKLKIILIQSLKLSVAIFCVIFSFMMIVLPIGIQMDYEKNNVWGYLFFIPIGITLLFVFMKVIDWDNLIEFPKWKNIEVNNNKKNII